MPRVQYARTHTRPGQGHAGCAGDGDTACISYTLKMLILNRLTKSEHHSRELAFGTNNCNNKDDAFISCYKSYHFIAPFRGCGFSFFSFFLCVWVATTRKQGTAMLDRAEMHLHFSLKSIRWMFSLLWLTRLATLQLQTHLDAFLVNTRTLVHQTSRLKQKGEKKGRNARVFESVEECCKRADAVHRQPACRIELNNGSLPV